MSAERLRILVIEDHLALRMSMAAMLESHGHRADFAADGRTGLQLALAEPPDVVVLDLTLPGMDGLQVCERLRAQADRHIPILMLTARDTLDDKLKGFEAGADDYLVKPFALAELTARIRALFRREVRGVTAVLSHGPVRLDTARQLAHRGERELRLTRKEFGVLRYLLTKPEAVVSAEELLQHVWDENADPFSQTVRVTVGTLRRKLTVDGEPQLLETLVGRGYRLRDHDSGE